MSLDRTLIAQLFCLIVRSGIMPLGPLMGPFVTGSKLIFSSVFDSFDCVSQLQLVLESSVKDADLISFGFFRPNLFISSPTPKNFEFKVSFARFDYSVKHFIK